MTFRWIKFIISAGCLAALLWWTDAANVVARLRDVDLMWLALALLAITAATFSMARRWQITARAFGIDLSYSTALSEYYLAQVINTVLPGGVAGDMTRAVRARHAADLSRAAQSVMGERLLGQIAILTLMFLGFLGAVLAPGGLDWRGLDWSVLAILLGFGVALAAMSRSDRAMGRFVRLTLDLLKWPSLLLHGVITTLCLIFAFYASARVTGVLIPAPAWATLIPLVLCAMLIPLSVGGWGWREGAAAALFPIIGAPAAAGIATGITYGLVLLAALLPAGLVLAVQAFSDNLPSKGKPDIS